MKIVFRRETTATTYAEVLLRYAVQDDTHNNVEEHCAALQAMGWQTGCVISPVFVYQYGGWCQLRLL